MLCGKTIIDNGWHKHFMVGLLLGLCLPFIFEHWLSFGISSFVFVGKEIYDCYKVNPTGFDWRDLLVDIIGYFVGFLITLLI